MSFISKLKHCLGFTDGYEEDSEVESFEDTEQGATEATDAQSTDANNQHSCSEIGHEVVEISPEMRHRIFDHAVEMFNQAMPAFLRESIDPDAQTRKLYDAMDKSIDDYLHAVEQQVKANCQRTFELRTVELNTELDTVRSKARELENERSSVKERQLSAERQKRALSDRINDLEQQLADSQATHEQLQLQVQSLLNKVKVAQIQGGDPEALQQLEDLRTENARLKEAVDKQSDIKAIGDVMLDEQRHEVAKARTELTEVKKLNEELDSQIQALKAEKERLESRLVDAGEVVEAAQELQRQFETMQSDMRKRDERISRLRAELTKRDDAVRKADEAYRQVCDENQRLNDRLERLSMSNIVVDDTASPYTALGESELQRTEPLPAGALSGVEKPAMAKPHPDIRNIEEAFEQAAREEVNWSTDSRSVNHLVAETKRTGSRRRQRPGSGENQLSLF